MHNKIKLFWSTWVLSDNERTPRKNGAYQKNANGWK